jgi:hypothetical protein
MWGYFSTKESAHTNEKEKEFSRNQENKVRRVIFL